MKILLNPDRRRLGSMLIVTALLAVVTGSALAYYLLRSEQESFNVTRSQAWNKALVIAEAGVEDAMALINRNNGDPTALTNWMDGASGDGWTTLTLGSGTKVYFISRSIGANYGKYTVFITNAIAGPTIYSIGTAYTIQANLTTNVITRRVMITSSSSAAFPGAITVKDSVDMNGNRVTVDSYNSADPFHSYWPNYPNGRGYGVYTNTDSTHNSIRNANGNVATDGLLIDAGNANIYGHVDTGPGGTTTVGSQGSVGGISWVDNSTQGIEPGYSGDDMNVIFPDVTLPATNWIAFSGNTITNNGYYAMNQITADFTITSRATNVVLYLTNGINYSGNKAFNIASNAYVTIYAGGSIDDGGNGTINNLSQHPSQLIIYGLPSLTSLTLHGNGALAAAVYAPSAVVSMRGSGNSGGFNGAITAKSLTMTGTSTISYDEALGKLNLNSGYVIKSWVELD